MTRRLALFGFLVVAFTIFLHYERTYAPANEYIRYMSTLAWSEEHSAYLDPVFKRLFPTWKEGNPPPNIDCSEVKGHYYLDKAPGLSALGAIFHPVLKNFIDPYKEGWKELDLLTLLIVTLPGLIFLWWLYSRTDDPFLIVALGIGSPFLLYGSTFFGILPAGLLAFCGYLLVKEKSRYFVGGLLLGLSILFEYPIFAVVAGVGIVVLIFYGTWKDKALYILGHVPVVLVQLAYNYLFFGNPLDMAYKHKVNQAFARIIDTGFFGLHLPSLNNAFNLLFSPQRGLFFLAPVLLIAFPPYLSKANGKRSGDYDFPIIFLTTLVIISSFVDWKAGASAGPRHLIGLLPFFALPMAQGLKTVRKQWMIRLVVLALALVSTFQNLLLHSTFLHLSFAIVNPIYHQTFLMFLSGCMYPVVIPGMSPIVVFFLLLLGSWGILSYSILHTLRVKGILFGLAALVLALGIMSSNATPGSIPKNPVVLRKVMRVFDLRGCQATKIAKIWARMNTAP